MINLIKALFLESFRNKISFFSSILLPVIFFLIFAFVFSDEVNVTFAYFCNNRLDIPGVYFEDKEKLLKEKDKYSAVAIIEDEIVVYKNYDDYTVDLWINDIKQKVATTIDVLRINEKELDYIKLSEKERIYLGSFVLSLISIGMFSSVNLFERYRNFGVIKRFKLLPLSAFQFIFSFSISQFIVSFFSFVIVRLIGLVVFSIDLKVNYFYFLLSFVSAVIGMLGIGSFLSVVFKKSASSIAQFLYTIFVFFSGVYFPLNFLPDFLKRITYFLPVKYINENFQYSIFRLFSFERFLLQNLFLLSFGIIFLYVGGKILFSKEEWVKK
ncbi:ABC transporter [Thermosipho melanesiensis]|uniref:ABC-2 type transporter n=2 Tax=Thermosipho melanesiensis TaxID=46541 RepID=A6LJC8_THEM4|nr:ABC transporter permease [Thermosipho melanesiensis]ABR30029.1 ABC-2 type transporter [Thermosipho melanesiensis BI429]APT73230.1 ABC transporter [Thermosipho melanesiensis]OOC38623.1 ABC transporter [Thermosipho melanesiensis]OOC40427.1 ABC transporter [Thermosipho melanesiensis]OOC40692.1 ABC transporter [Thermosipho melanesiensis]